MKIEVERWRREFEMKGIKGERWRIEGERRRMEGDR